MVFTLRDETVHCNGLRDGDSRSGMAVRLEKFFEGENGVCFGWVKADFGAPRSVQGEDSTAVLSGTLLPHPSTAAPAHPPYPRVPVAPVQPASAHSAASLDPRCGVGRLARFRQEGSLVYLSYMRDSMDGAPRIRT